MSERLALAILVGLIAFVGSALLALCLIYVFSMNDTSTIHCVHLTAIHAGFCYY